MAQILGSLYQTGLRETESAERGSLRSLLVLSHHRIRVNAGLGRMPVACRYFQECKHLKKTKKKTCCADVEACISGFQLFMYVHVFCMHGNVHEWVCVGGALHL